MRDFSNKRICILGCGKTGEAGVIFFKKFNCEIFAFDDKKDHLQEFCKKHQISEFTHQEFDILFVSPGIPNNQHRKHHIISSVSNAVEITSDIEILQKMYLDAKYIGITGTNGKSTTTELVGHILKSSLRGKRVQVCGNIGTPVLSVDEADIYVIELSSYQIDLIPNPKLDVAVCLNITPDHIDRYGTFENYMHSKARIFSDSSTNIISVDYSHCKEVFGTINRAIPISREKYLEVGISAVDGKVFMSNCLAWKGTTSFNLPKNTSLLGKYNTENILAAVAVCLAFKVDLQDVISGLETFVGLPHRMEIVTHNSEKNITFINDSKATNVMSARAAFEALRGKKIIWIAGGICKDDGIEQLSEFFQYIHKAYLVGASMDQFYEVLSKHGVDAKKSGFLEIALNDICKTPTENSVVLLSPACASTDQWKNFEERGNFFRNRIKGNSN
jgi:UDP-N-acetylmuramoylalanine--D-glutamate ligase